ncbi:heat shock protein 23-like [Sitodiplosis mosellana]|uniref:heat shock protein 23-like n=1 Tax=Sitodiplosis mosellana TaxID=263140 RepID=UPI002444CD37|nr:heat shock protein 23-like [Sitodiplosis mosellana]
MSLLPYILGDFLPPKRYNSSAGSLPSHLSISPKELELIQSLIRYGQLRRLIDFNRLAPKSHIGKDGFEVRLNVENFRPEEITIKTVDDSVIIEAKNERKNDNELVSSHCRRRYELPSGFRPEEITATMSSDGVLTVKCPRASIDKNNVRQIEVKQTGPARQIDDVDKKSEQQEKKADRCRVF